MELRRAFAVVLFLFALLSGRAAEAEPRACAKESDCELVGQHCELGVCAGGAPASEPATRPPGRFAVGLKASSLELVALDLDARLLRNLVVGLFGLITPWSGGLVSILGGEVRVQGAPEELLAPYAELSAGWSRTPGDSMTGMTLIVGLEWRARALEIQPGVGIIDLITEHDQNVSGLSFPPGIYFAAELAMRWGFDN